VSLEEPRTKPFMWHCGKEVCYTHQEARNLLSSSSSSESLWMVMMLTAGLGVSEMTMGWEWSPGPGTDAGLEG